MNRIENVLLNYLQTETNNAILLTGDWGSGKTHYIKNIFFEKARNIQTIGSGAKKNYQPVLISMFGVKSIDDIKDRIWVSLYPLLDNKYADYGASIFKCIVKSADVSKLLGKEGLLEGVIDNADKTAKEINKKAKEKLKFDNLLICLDDLERVNKEYLKEDEILGFINSLVEHENNKVILIANEDKLKSKRFKRIKEKTIGYTLHFEQNFQEVFDNIISAHSSTDAFKNFVSYQYNIIHSIFTKEGQGSVNYRTLNSFVSIFDQVYHAIEIQGIGIAPLNNKRESILIDILKFTIGVCIEFRKGEISYKERQNLEQYETLMISKSLGKESDENSYLIRFIDNYINEWNQYTFYTSIYETVTGGNIFEIDKLRQELRKKHNVIDDNIPIHYEIYNKLLEHDYLKIPDQEYKDLLRNLRDYSEQGMYQIVHYPSILYALMRDNNPLNLSEKRLVDKFIGIIKRNKNAHTYQPRMAEYFAPDPRYPFTAQKTRLIDVLLEINRETKDKYIDHKINILKKKFLDDFDAFFRQFLDWHYSKKGYFSFEGFSSYFLYTAFLRMSNTYKQDFVNLLYIGFFDTIYHLSSNEIKLFTSLKARVDNKLAKKNPKTNSTALFKKLQDVLGKILTSKGKV